MSKLNAFLNPTEGPVQEKEVVISKRFLDENGKLAPFKIRSLTQEENDVIIKKSTYRVSGKNGTEERLDSQGYLRRLVVAGTVYPDFSENELCERYGTKIPEEVPGKMLSAGEFSKLANAISDLSGFGDEDIEEEAKN